MVIREFPENSAILGQPIMPHFSKFHLPGNIFLKMQPGAGSGSCREREPTRSHPRAPPGTPAVWLLHPQRIRSGQLQGGERDRLTERHHQQDLAADSKIQKLSSLKLNIFKYFRLYVLHLKIRIKIII